MEDSLVFEVDLVFVGVVKKFKVMKWGLLKGFEWVNVFNLEFGVFMLVGDEVIVDIRVVGMNFKDIFIVMGVIDG